VFIHWACRELDVMGFFFFLDVVFWFHFFHSFLSLFIFLDLGVFLSVGQ